ncbi:MAG: SDR family oxidoreductase [Chloroflexi bacterium]|nr:SDR family oxidoreductase [Chloroflexota bacterium]MBI3170133.1 SDR family oxidoreductase [Chloroflexota bacterium]
MKNIVVTGANNGIGYHMTRSLLTDGYSVAGLDVSIENLQVLEASPSNRLRAIRCDVSDSVQVNKAVDDILQQWAQIDVLVNNACIVIFKPFEQRTVEETRREFEVNYFGYLHTIQAVFPHMKARGNGIIHNMSSGVGITGFPGISGYASTKGAIESLTRTLSLEFEKYGIVVNLMHPPLTNTKSASPLGVPAQAMDDPARVGEKLAKQILSTKPILASDFRTAMYLFFAYRYPKTLGGLFAKLTENAVNPKGDSRAN